MKAVPGSPAAEYFKEKVINRTREGMRDVTGHKWDIPFDKRRFIFCDLNGTPVGSISYRGAKELLTSFE